MMNSYDDSDSANETQTHEKIMRLIKLRKKQRCGVRRLHDDISTAARRSLNVQKISQKDGAKVSESSVFEEEEIMALDNNIQKSPLVTPTTRLQRQSMVCSTPKTSDLPQKFVSSLSPIKCNSERSICSVTPTTRLQRQSMVCSTPKTSDLPKKFVSSLSPIKCNSERSICSVFEEEEIMALDTKIQESPPVTLIPVKKQLLRELSSTAEIGDSEVIPETQGEYDEMEYGTSVPAKQLEPLQVDQVDSPLTSTSTSSNTVTQSISNTKEMSRSRRPTKNKKKGKISESYLSFLNLEKSVKRKSIKAGSKRKLYSSEQEFQKLLEPRDDDSDSTTRRSRNFKVSPEKIHVSVFDSDGFKVPNTACRTIKLTRNGYPIITSEFEVVDENIRILNKSRTNVVPNQTLQIENVTKKTTPQKAIAKPKSNQSKPSRKAMIENDVAEQANEMRRSNRVRHEPMTFWKVHKRIGTFRECYVDMEFLNPGIWLYNFTVDIRLNLRKELKPRSIIRSMNGYLNLDKPKIPISYIPKYQIHRVITGKTKLLEYTNLEELCKDYYSTIKDSAILQKKIRGYAKFIIKNLKDDDFRQSSLFERILIKPLGLYEDVNSYVIKMDEFMRLRRMAELENMQNDNEIQMDQPDVIPDNQTNYLDQIDRNISNINKDVVNGQAEESEMEEIPLCNQLTSQNSAAFLSQVCNNCKTFEDFVQFTNVKELAAKRLNYLNNKHVKKQLAEIIIENTWKQIQVHSKTDDKGIICFVETNVHNTERYINMDKTIVPFNYLREFHILFPNLFTFVKYTNVIRLLKENYRLNVEGVTKSLHEWYDDLLKNPQTLNKKYSRLKINAKYLFLKQYEQPLMTYNNEMIQEEVYNQFDKGSSSSYILPAFPVGIASKSSDIPEKPFGPQKIFHILPNESTIGTLSNELVQKSPNILMSSREIIGTISNENVEMDLELNLITRESSSVAEQNEKPKDADNLDEADKNIITTLINPSSDIVEVLPTTSTLIASQLSISELDTSPKELPQLPLTDGTEDSSIQKSLQDHRNRRTKYNLRNKYLPRRYISQKGKLTQEKKDDIAFEQSALTSAEIQILPESPISSMNDTIINNTQTQLFNSQQRHISNIPVLETESVANDTLSPTIEHSPKIPTTENVTKKILEKVEKLYNFIQNHANSINEKLDNILNGMNHTEKVTEFNVLQPNSDNVDLDINQRNLDKEVFVKTEPQSQYSPCSEVEIIEIESELIQVEDSMSVSQLFASDNDQTQNITDQNGKGDALKKLKLNNSIDTDDGLLQRINAVLDESNVVPNRSSDLTTSQNLELSYNDLIQHPNKTECKRGRRKRKISTENQQNEIINGRKVKPVDLRNSSYATVQNQHITTASQLLNTQMSLFLDSQLSSSKISTNQPPICKGTRYKNREAAKRKLYENDLLTKSHTK